MSRWRPTKYTQTRAYFLPVAAMFGDQLEGPVSAYVIFGHEILDLVVLLDETFEGSLAAKGPFRSWRNLLRRRHHRFGDSRFCDEWDRYTDPAESRALKVGRT